MRALRVNQHSKAAAKQLKKLAKSHYKAEGSCRVADNSLILIMKNIDNTL